MLKSGQLSTSMPAGRSPSSLNILPRDILAIILDHVQQTSPEAIRNVKLVNSQLCALARYCQLQEVELDLSVGSEARLAFDLAIIKSPDSAKAVRSITIQERVARVQGSEVVRRQLLTTLCALIPLMSGLQEVNYCSSNIAEEILRALQKRPDIRLATAVSTLATPTNIGSDNLRSLCGNVNLRSLDVKVTYLTASDCSNVMVSLKRLLLSCPNLRCLSLDVSQPSSGCVVYGPSREYCGLGFVEQETLPALNQLTLINYPFGHHPDSGPIVNTLGYPGTGREIDYWAQNFDWSRLTRLSTGSHDFAMQLTPWLTSIREVEALQQWSKQDAAAFFANIPTSLVEISVPSVHHFSLDGLLRHSKTLRKLHVHQTERYGLNWADEAIGVDLLRRLQLDFALFDDLCLDIARDETWPYSVFDVLAEFPRLKTLELWFELGINRAQSPLKPFVTLDAARHIFHYIRSRSPHRNPRLQRLVLHSGAPPETGFGFPSEDAFWPKYNSTSFICQLSDRDDDAAAGIFSVTCPDLVHHQHKKQRSDPQGSRPTLMEKVLNLARKSKRRTEKTGNDVEASIGNARSEEAMLVAFEGPRTRSQWRSHY